MRHSIPPIFVWTFLIETRFYPLRPGPARQHHADRQRQPGCHLGRAQSGEHKAAVAAKAFQEQADRGAQRCKDQETGPRRRVAQQPFPRPDTPQDRQRNRDFVNLAGMAVGASQLDPPRKPRTKPPEPP
ncbi:MAG TPA: hypothetical protein VF498_06475 [Anaerolineales bacterium]